MKDALKEALIEHLQTRYIKPAGFVDTGDE
jgi:hypothetical protein